jgi:hypothetical protein
LFIAVAAIIAVLAFGVWWLQFSAAAVERRRGEKERELERPDHGRALEIAKIKSELSKVKSWW